jgi:hypothetical protein
MIARSQSQELGEYKVVKVYLEDIFEIAYFNFTEVLVANVVLVDDISKKVFDIRSVLGVAFTLASNFHHEF